MDRDRLIKVFLRRYVQALRNYLENKVNVEITCENIFRDIFETHSNKSVRFVIVENAHMLPLIRVKNTGN